MAATRRKFGFEVRKPFASEKTYFKANRHVAGMATADNKITLNPFSRLPGAGRQAVMKNEAARLLLRKKRKPFSFSVTPAQRRAFKGTPYGKPENAQNLRDTIIARKVSGDPSAGRITRKQDTAAQRVASKLKRRQNISRSR